MRTREEIKKQLLKEYENTTPGLIQITHEGLILEALLDIRDLLTNNHEEK